MQGCFVELPAFERVRERYLDDDAYASLQSLMLADFWLFALYAKGEAEDLTPRQLAGLREYLKADLKMRKCN
jgi:hypothetical protein